MAGSVDKHLRVLREVFGASTLRAKALATQASGLKLGDSARLADIYEGAIESQYIAGTALANALVDMLVEGYRTDSTLAWRARAAIEGTKEKLSAERLAKARSRSEHDPSRVLSEAFIRGFNSVGARRREEITSAHATQMARFEAAAVAKAVKAADARSSRMEGV
jgi:hypothetical protein